MIFNRLVRCVSARRGLPGTHRSADCGRVCSCIGRGRRARSPPPVLPTLAGATHPTVEGEDLGIQSPHGPLRHPGLLAGHREVRPRRRPPAAPRPRARAAAARGHSPASTRTSRAPARAGVASPGIYWKLPEDGSRPAPPDAQREVADIIRSLPTRARHLADALNSVGGRDPEHYDVDIVDQRCAELLFSGNLDHDRGARHAACAAGRRARVRGVVRGVRVDGGAGGRLARLVGVHRRGGVARRAAPAGPPDADAPRAGRDAGADRRHGRRA